MTRSRPHRSPAGSTLPIDRGPDVTTFHAIKYSMGELFTEIANVLTLSDLPPYDVVLSLDKRVRAIEAAAPSWLRWGDRDITTGDDRITLQKHMLALLKDKALLGRPLAVHTH